MLSQSARYKEMPCDMHVDFDGIPYKRPTKLWPLAFSTRRRLIEMTMAKVILESKLNVGTIDGTMKSIQKNPKDMSRYRCSSRRVL
jgi:hypothetical protein